MSDEEWLKRWRQNNKQLDKQPRDKIMSPAEYKRNEREWDNVRFRLRYLYGDVQLDRVAIACSR